MRRAGLLLLAVGVALCAPPPERSNLLHVPVWATSRESAPLDKASLSAKVNGAPAAVEAVHGPSDDLVLLLTLDLTDDLSLAGLAKDALVSSLDALPSNANVAVLRAQDGLSVLLDPTADRARAGETVRDLPVSGKAGLLDTIATSVRVADSILDKAAVRVAVVYITDSSIQNYREDFINPVINSSDEHDMSRRFPGALIREKISKLEGKLAPYEAPVFIVHIAYRADSLNDAYQTGLLQLIPSWGGSSALCRSRAEVSENIVGAFRAAQSHYSVVLRLPERRAKTLQVQLDAPHHSLSYRNRFLTGR
ncbi:MAG TPA: hypothetical protein VHA11_00255 [Bryobacteraceae bacterium]|nr:hypothetical protein [Bryobacteraceae bacterium]